MEEIDISYPLEMLKAYREAQTQMASLPEEMGRRALDGARQVVVEAVLQIDGANERLGELLATETSDSLIETLESLASKREVLSEYGANTDKIDKEIAEAEERWSAFELALFLSVGAPVVASTAEVVPANVDTPTEQVQDDSEIRVKPEYKLSIGEHPESGNTVLVMRGAKKPADIMLLELWQIELI